MADAAFSGFPPGTFAFLRGLGRNNDKAWFDAHRDDCQASYVEPARARPAVGWSSGIRRLLP